MFGYGGYGMYGGAGGGFGFNPWVWIILILIVLQWFRVGNVGGAGGVLPENGLLCNGGLFIIALFLLAACGCFRGPVCPPPVAPIRTCC